MKKIGVIGHFGHGLNLHDGQTVKTRTLADALESYYGNKVMRVDTYNYKKTPFKLIIGLLRCLVNCDSVFVLLSRNGRRIILPLVAKLSRVCHCKIYHCLIGGNLADEVEKNPNLAVVLNNLSKNWVETHSLVERLQQLGVRNSEYLPNFKKLNPINISMRKYSLCPPFKLCTFSRVMEEKGITDAIRAVKKINELKNETYCVLDIFGPIEKSYGNSFKAELQECDAARYCGIVPYSDTVDVLSRYDLLLFPTKWEGEGVPGTIIDAFAAGLPVIARRWRYHDEMLKDGITGLSFTAEDIEVLADCVLSVLKDPAVIGEYGKNCREQFEMYSIEFALKIINNALLIR